MFRFIGPVLLSLVLAAVPLMARPLDTPAPAPAPGWMAEAVAGLEAELAAKYGEAIRPRARTGLEQVALFWRAEDGGQLDFEQFTRAHFAGDAKTLDMLFDRYESLLEKLDGHLYEIARAFRTQVDLDLGPILPWDEAFAAYNPYAHVNDDFFANKLAFTVLLNFPLTTLESRLANGDAWSRRQWAEARLADRFAKRVPADVAQALSRAQADSDQYIAGYNIWMHHLLDAAGERPFPPKLRLLSHWNLRDELKACYADSRQGPAKQRMIQAVMERIVTQTIPAAVVDNPNVDWNPFTNAVTAAAVKDSDVPAPAGATVSGEREPDTRYRILLQCFKAERLLDAYSPTAPTLMERRFNEDREIPEARVRAMLEQVVSSPLAPKVANLIASRLGRPLEPFDIWYNGFLPRGRFPEAQLDEMVKKRYPTAAAFQQDIPNMLVALGFSRERADFLASRIVVDPARGSGHAAGAAMRGEKAHLRTRVGPGGMDYKGFNIAVHEMGHNVEQVFSLDLMDHWLLQGVPNTAFTEAFAYMLQDRDLRVLGVSSPEGPNAAAKTLADFWNTYEISGVALVDMGIWRWMYEHPEATPAELREASAGIAKDVWNRYYAPIFGHRDVVLLGVYSHIIHSFLYLPDYAIGHLIHVQIEEKVKESGHLGAEFERMATIGRVAPDVWMKRATGAAVSADALLKATEKALVAFPAPAAAKP